MVMKLFKVVWMIILAVGLSGCSTLQVSDTIGKVALQPKPPVTLTVLLWPGTGLEPLIQRYDKEHPGIKVVIQTDQFEDVHNNLQTAFAAGIGAPDICIVETSLIDRFKAFPDYFYNLSDYGADDVEKDFLDWSWQQALSIDHKFIFGLPTDVGPIAMIYRKDLFREAGLPVDREAVAREIATWDDFLEAGKQIRERTGKPMLDNLNNLFRSILGQADSQYYDKHTGKLIVGTNPNVKRAWHYAVKTAEMNLSANIVSWMPEWGTGAKTGQFAAILAPAWKLSFIKNNAPDAAGDWDMTYLPEGSGNWGGSFLTMPKEGKYPKEAYELIRWLTSPEQQLDIFNNNGNFPSTPGIYDNPMISGKHDDYFSGAPVGTIYAETAKTVKPAYKGPYYHIVTKEFEDALQKIERKQMSPQEAWNDALKRLEQEIGQN